MTPKVISHHIFICPFRIDGIGFDFTSYTPGGSWEPFKFEIKAPRDFNERVYFYDFVYDALFEDGVEGRPLKQYCIKEYEDPTNPKYYTILGRFKDEGDSVGGHEIYSLQIDNVTLNIYETGIAVFAFHLNNHDYEKIEDIKRINDLGRRMYPQFLINNKGTVDILDGSFIPANISISNKKFESYKNWKNKNNEDDLVVEEDFSKYLDFEKGFGKSKNDKDLLPNTINHFLRTENTIFNYCPLIDDRMFVISYIGDISIVEKVFHSEQSEKDQLNKEENGWRSSEDWHNLLFCDHAKNGNHSSSKLRYELNDSHTYFRWEGYNTLIGVTKDSFIALTRGEAYSDFIRVHCMTMYFQMVQLCLVQRASILKFSSDAAKLAGDINPRGNDPNLNDLKKLQISYIRFMNRLHYREVTAQEQGIDLYDMLQEKMRIPDQLKELDDEIQEMVSLTNMLKVEEDNSVLKRLTNVATIFLIPSLITGFLGMNIINWRPIVSAPWSILGWITFLIIGAFCLFVIMYGVRSFFKIKEQKKDYLIEFIHVLLYMSIGAIVMMIILNFT